MAVTKQDGDKNDPNPISCRRLPADFGCTSEQVSSIGDFFTERRKGPDNKQRKHCQLDISSYGLCSRRRDDRRPNVPSERFNDEVSQDDSQSGRGQRDEDKMDP